MIAKALHRASIGPNSSTNSEEISLNKSITSLGTFLMLVTISLEVALIISAGYGAPIF